MKLIEALGPFSYEITGENEAAAAEYLENALDFLSRASTNFDADWADAQETAKKRFGVTIRIHEDA